jgi:hypothetical protein
MLFRHLIDGFLLQSIQNFGSPVFHHKKDGRRGIQSVCVSCVAMAPNGLNPLHRTGKDELLETAMALHDAAIKDEYFVKRKLAPNVDFW